MHSSLPYVDTDSELCAMSTCCLGPSACGRYVVLPETRTKKMGSVWGSFLNWHCPQHHHVEDLCWFVAPQCVGTALLLFGPVCLSQGWSK